MATIQPDSGRLALVTAAHHFLLTALPLRHPESHNALHDFVSKISRNAVAAETDAVLLRVLSVLDPFTGGRLPSLVDHYLTARSSATDRARVFQTCVEDVLRHRSITDPLVQRAISLIDKRYTDPHLSQRGVADHVGLPPARFAVRFKLQTSLTFRHYVRRMRLSLGGTLLSRTDKRVKEIWAQIGYNHGSNFDHDFKRHFGVSPREYRARVIRRETLGLEETFLSRRGSA